VRKAVVVAPLVGLLALAFAVMPAASAATARPRPSASFSFRHDKVSTRTKPVLSYVTSNLPAGVRIYLQRQFGSAHAWKNVEQLKARRGTATAPAVALGEYGYRLHVMAGHRVVVTSRSHKLYSYGTVPLSALCPADGISCPAHTIQVGDTIFTYVLVGNGDYPDYNPALELNSTSCDSLSLQFAAAYDTNTSDSAYVEVIQSKTDPQYGSTLVGTIGSFRASLDGGPFYLETAETVDADVVMNGTASCYTPSGTP